MSEMSEGAKAAWERWEKAHPFEANIMTEVGLFAAGFEDCLAAMEQEAAKLDKASSDESLWRESQILFISQAIALRMAIWSIKKGQEANK